MPVSFNEKLIAYFTLLSGLAITVVAEYYSILGLTVIFSAAIIPVVIMGIVLGFGKISATLWLKQNWKIAPISIRAYLILAILSLMLITSMGIFGFLSKAHSDQNLISGDVIAKLAIYDEKIKTAKENIETNRQYLRQLDESVDQLMSRSSTELGANRAVSVRKSQAKERTRILSEIQNEQALIVKLTEERAPIAAELRKVEAEVGPLKYIAALIYGDNIDGNLLESAVRWVIILLVIVFDPLAIILLLSSQISFQEFRKKIQENNTDKSKSVSKIIEEDIDNEVIDHTSDKDLNKLDDPDIPEEIKETENSKYQIIPELQEELNKVVEKTEIQTEEKIDSEEENKIARAISEDDYLNISREKLEQRVNYYASLLRNGHIEPKDIPRPLLTIVKSRV